MTKTTTTGTLGDLGHGTHFIGAPTPDGTPTDGLCAVCFASGEPDADAVGVIEGTDIPACAECAAHVSARDLTGDA